MFEKFRIDLFDFDCRICSMKKNLPIFFVLLLALFAGLSGGFLSFYALQQGFKLEIGEKSFEIKQEEVFSEEAQIVDAIQKVSPAVVSVVAFSGSNEAGDFRQISGGTGFIVSENGLVLTNKHVVLDESFSYKIVLADENEFEAKVLSRDLFDDIAVLQIVSKEARKFPVAEFGDSDALAVGQKVLAIGNALAEYQNTVTLGIVSAKGRQIFAYNDAGLGSVENFAGLIQTDAAINLGNSGGPLINLEGQVVGMNSALEQSANAIGFAIPINDLKPVLKSVLKYGEIIRPVLGVRFVMLTKKQAYEIDPTLSYGAFLIGDGGVVNAAIVENGSADLAGLLERDVILEVNDLSVDENRPLQSIIRQYEPGDVLKMKVWRAGKIMEFEVKLKSSKDL